MMNIFSIFRKIYKIIKPMISYNLYNYAHFSHKTLLVQDSL